jgi:hypothetical protein
MPESLDLVGVSITIENWVDYLVVGQARIIWFAAVEDDQHYEGPPSWKMLDAKIVAYGRDLPKELKRQEIEIDVVELLAVDTLARPVTKYRCSLVEAKQTVVSDPVLTGFYAVRWLASSYEHSETCDIKGYDLFLLLPSGYVMMVVQREDGRPDVEFVIRPQDVPEGYTMMNLVDASMEAVGLEITDSPLSLAP